ncbi:MAG: bifunctional 4-hydroxy-2-oxoglutarate aldolase/2-dehydro-3-deoxy-phosphogluconate aldolase [Nocardioidaceae bacterium]|nr:bifunctional 4-hydroxy-2-oxoglutarate aldolase/2-dehydro-3-deoxy-phosphogluconate aldolase [Nocardioidaceae bacterium]
MTLVAAGSTGSAPDPLETMAATGLVAVVVIDRVADAEPLADALVSAGLPLVEVTLRTPEALGALRAAAAVPGAVVGAGTVLTPAQVEAAVAAGARYVVSPGLSDGVVDECAALGVPCLPGVATATEIQRALEHGLDVVKLFPAEACGGVAMVRALSAPFPGLRFVPTGGIGAATLPDYLAVASVLAVGGSWMVPRDAVAAGDLARITDLTRAAVALARGGAEVTR